VKQTDTSRQRGLQTVWGNCMADIRGVCVFMNV